MNTNNEPLTRDGLQSRSTSERVANPSHRCVFKPFDAEAEVSRRHRHLPHWQQAGATYFITFRLGDALPEAKLDQWKQERARWLGGRGLASARDVERLPETERRAFHRCFTTQLERWLDDGIGSCLLRVPRAAEIVADALRYFDGQRCALDEFVIMPNHVHVICCPFGDWMLEQLLHSWKRHSARQINQLMGRTGPLWLDEYFDHAVRNLDQLAKYRRYICENPVKACLRQGEFLLGRGSGVHPICGTGLQPVTSGAGFQPAPTSESPTADGLQTRPTVPHTLGHP